MRKHFRSTSARLLGAAAGSALVVAVLIVANPFPGSVYGQTVPGSTVPDDMESAPGVAVSPVSATVSVLGVAESPSSGAAPVVTSQAPAGVAVQPVALPRTGVGLTADSGFSDTIGYGLLALAAALGSAAAVMRTVAPANDTNTRNTPPAGIVSGRRYRFLTLRR
jgi:hypothetical protein